MRILYLSASKAVHMFNLILFGPPGSGKGTQSEKLIARYGFKHLSTGDLLRNEIKNGTSLGLEAKSLMDQGQLVPDAVVIGMIRTALEQNPTRRGFSSTGSRVQTLRQTPWMHCWLKRVQQFR